MPRPIRNSPAVDEDIYGTSPAPRRGLNNSWQQSRRQTEQPTALSPSPPANSSDKENAPVHRSKKGKGRAEMPTPSSEEDGNGRKRRQTLAEDNPRPAQRPRISTEAEAAEENEKDYDPNQDPSKLRNIRKGYRELEGKVHENRAELLKSSDSLVNTLNEANEYFKDVKQTAVATIDSRILVQVADTSYRHTLQLSLGDSVTGVDIDEFVGKCITFMKSEDNDAPGAQFSHSQSHGHRRRHTRGDADDDEDVDDGDELNWARLGSSACLRYNSRPSVPGFLLGPLSIEKKARKVTQRVARLRPSQYTQTQPVMLKAGELEHDETKALTHLTKMIYARMVKTRRERVDKHTLAKERFPNMSHSDAKKLMESHGLLYPRKSLNLWQFVVNPRSFGQTVENIFYVSFLIRDGKARLDPDDDGQIGLGESKDPNSSSCVSHELLVPENSGNGEVAKGKNSTKYQGIISIDMKEWKELIDLYDIKESMIEHRNEAGENVLPSSGWV